MKKIKMIVKYAFWAALYVLAMLGIMIILFAILCGEGNNGWLNLIAE